MRLWSKPSWPFVRSLLKFVFALAILVAIGRQFALDLRGHSEIRALPLRPGWLMAAGLLYLLGLGLSAIYWHRLLWRLGQRTSLLAALRAYYVSQSGKYLPGKAWALFFRAALAHEGGVSTGTAVASSFYEVLSTMCSGVFLALVIFGGAVLDGSDGFYDLSFTSLREFVRGQPRLDILAHPWIPAVLALVLVLLVGTPIVPPIFNRLVGRIAAPFRSDDSRPLPKFDWTALGQGLGMTAGGWFFLSASLWMVVQAVLIDPPAWSFNRWFYSTAYLALAYVGGFIILLVPSGLGVRELLLTPFLAVELEQVTELSGGRARALALLIVLVLRMVWTLAEILIIAVLYWVPVRTLRHDLAAHGIDT
jgi:uncharacterized membrane protein YbhN (UPF0104 family)